jgi:hypothetical protein
MVERIDGDEPERPYIAAGSPIYTAPEYEWSGGEPDGTLHELEVAVAKARQRTIDGLRDDPEPWMIDPKVLDAYTPRIPIEYMVESEAVRDNITMLSPELTPRESDDMGIETEIEVLRFKTDMPTIRWAAGILGNDRMYNVKFEGGEAGAIVSIRREMTARYW